MDKAERTLAIIKPDAFKMGFAVVCEIVRRYQEVGLRVVDFHEIQMSRILTENLYREHIGKHYWPELLAFCLSGRMMALLLEGPHAVSLVRETNGPTYPAKAPKGTIRGDFGTDKGWPDNAVHGSASVEEAKREIALIFD
jgi:nucleoside-diphosphate kinase